MDMLIRMEPDKGVTNIRNLCKIIRPVLPQAPVRAIAKGAALILRSIRAFGYCEGVVIFPEVLRMRFAPFGKGFQVISLLIKVMLALFAFSLAVIGLSDTKTLHDDNCHNGMPWWRRLTKWGAAKLAIAFGTLLLVAVNEYRGYSSSLIAAENEKRYDAKLEIASNQLYMIKKSLSIQNLDLDAEISGKFIIDLPFPTSKNPEKFVGLIPYDGIDGEIASGVVHVPDVVTNKFTLNSTNAGIIIRSTDELAKINSETLVDFDSLGCGLCAPQGVSGKWWVELIAPYYSYGFQFKSQANLRTMLVMSDSMESEGVGLIAIKKRRVNDYDVLSKFYAEISAHFKFHTTVKNKSGGECVVNLIIPLKFVPPEEMLYMDNVDAKFDEKYWRFYMVPSATPSVMACEEIPW